LNLVASYVLLSPLLVRLLIDSRILQIYSIKPCSKFLTFSMHLFMIITSCNQYSVKFRPMFLLISAKTNQNFRPCLRFSDVTLFTQHLVLSVAFLARNRQTLCKYLSITCYDTSPICFLFSIIYIHFVQ
jgi:hypothetical protein